MNFSCDACGRAYSVPDEKVQGRAFRVTCRQCGNQIRVAAGQPAAAAAPPRPPPPAAPPRPPPPPAPPRPHLTPPTTHVAGAGTAPRSAALQGMTDAEMAWLGSATPPPRPLTPPPPEPTAPAEPVPGSTTDVEAAEAAFAALEAAAREEPGAEAAPARPSLDSGPDELPPLPEPEEAGPAAATPRGPGALRTAAAALLVLVAGALVAWQLGWFGTKTPGPVTAPLPPELARPVLPPVQPPAPEPAAAPTEAPPTPADPAAALPAAAPAVPGDAPAPAVGPARRPAPPAAGDRATKNLRIGRKDRRLLDLLEKKGDAAPAAPIERSTLDTGLAELDQPAVERAMAESRPAFAACVTRALKADPTLKLDDQKATLMLTVRPNGTVSRAWVAEADLESTPLGRCLVGAARRVVFPAFQGDALDVSAPLVLGAIR